MAEFLLFKQGEIHYVSVGAPVCVALCRRNCRGGEFQAEATHDMPLFSEPRYSSAVSDCFFMIGIAVTVADWTSVFHALP